MADQLMQTMTVNSEWERNGSGVVPMARSALFSEGVVILHFGAVAAAPRVFSSAKTRIDSKWQPSSQILLGID